MPDTAQLVYLSGPSGVGKSSVGAYMEAEGLARRILAVKTRSPRPQESDGADAWFVDVDWFHQARSESRVVGCNLVFGEWYGFRAADLTPQTDGPPMRVLEVYGPLSASLRASVGMGTSVYLLPDELGWVADRLLQRDGARAAEARVRALADELAWFDSIGRPDFDSTILVTRESTTPSIATRISSLVTGGRDGRK